MKLNHIDEMPVLEHQDVCLYLTLDEYASMTPMNHAQIKLFLWNTVMVRLHQNRQNEREEGKEESILKTWLEDQTINWTHVTE